MIDLRFSSVSKCYKIRNDHELPAKTIVSSVFRRRARVSEFWALRNVNFEVKRGEALGIIGHNGAGKSTILKLLSNITTPTKGEISINGKLSALLEVGSGFHPELSGRENIFLSGAILGMRRSEIKRKLDSIIDFAEMRTLIDTPAKKYSSGMFVRLGFSIAAHLDPDILLLDEVLAVGDREFQERCKNRIRKMHESGTTMIFISHDLAAVREVCGRVILLQRGEVIADGSPDAVIHQYTQSVTRPRAGASTGQLHDAELADVLFQGPDGQRMTSFRTGNPVSARVDFLINRDIPRGSISLFFYGIDGTMAAQWTTSASGSFLKLKEGPGSIEFSCSEFGLQSGVYRIDAHIEDCTSKQIIDQFEGCATIHVESAMNVEGGFYMPHNWRLVPRAEDY